MLDALWAPLCSKLRQHNLSRPNVPVHVCAVLANCAAQHVATLTISPLLQFCRENFGNRKSKLQKFTKIVGHKNLEQCSSQLKDCLKVLKISRLKCLATCTNSTVVPYTTAHCYMYHIPYSIPYSSKFSSCTIFANRIVWGIWWKQFSRNEEILLPVHVLLYPK